MKILSIACMVMLVVMSVGTAFALPGVYTAGAASMTLDIGQCETRTISLDGTGFDTPLLISGGFLIQNTNDKVADITDCKCYDGTLTPAIWEPVFLMFDPTGYPGGLFVATANTVTGVTPSSDILLCDVTVCGVYDGTTAITIDTVPDFDTWVGCFDWPCTDSNVHDSTIDAAFISVAVYWHPCDCSISGPAEVQANVSGDPVTATYYIASWTSGCENPPSYLYSDDCVHGTINPNTGILTVPASTSPPEENCTITATDTANTDINTGDPVVCTLDITILAGTCECEGNFDNDEDVDGFDAATFKLDFGRGGFTSPCINSDLCNGDFNCDGDADGTDAALFKQDFGRSGLINPCPSCPRDPWCVYP